MSDTPTQRELRSEFDRILAAHERRARLITQLHRQAIATANDLSPRQKTIEAGIARDARRRKTEAWLIAWLIAAGAIFVALGCILAVVG
jgi:type VI protein secretion system component VasF